MYPRNHDREDREFRLNAKGNSAAPRSDLKQRACDVLALHFGF